MKHPIRKIIYSLVFLGLTACRGPIEDQKSQLSIYSKNPTATNITDLQPYSSVVSITKNQTPHCSGVAISKGYVLTAAHCLSLCGTTGTYECRTLGEAESYLVKDTFDNEYAIDAIILPKKVSIANNIMAEGFDLALLRLKWDFKQKTTPLATADKAARILEDNLDRMESSSQTLITAGYGAFEDTNKPVWYDGRLRAAYVPFRSYFGIFDNDEILAGSTKVHAAKGDSGGPLLIDDGSGRLTVVGIASRLFTFNSANTFDSDGALYAHVSSPRLSQWIVTQMRESGGNLQQNEDDSTSPDLDTDKVIEQEIATFSSLTVWDNRQFLVPRAMRASLDILIKGKATELLLKDADGEELQRNKIQVGSKARIELNFAKAGLYHLSFSCPSFNCDSTKIESINIYSKQ